jgi:hypothetical protein
MGQKLVDEGHISHVAEEGKKFTDSSDYFRFKAHEKELGEAKDPKVSVVSMEDFRIETHGIKSYLLTKTRRWIKLILRDRATLLLKTLSIFLRC